jgi:hypothetical protein
MTAAADHPSPVVRVEVRNASQLPVYQLAVEVVPLVGDDTASMGSVIYELVPPGDGS